MDSTTENDYFELEPFDQYKPPEVFVTYFFLFLIKIVFVFFFNSKSLQINLEL